MATRCYFNSHANDVSDIDLSGSLIGNWDQGSSAASQILSLDEKLTGRGLIISCTKTGSSAVRVISTYGQYITNSLDAVTLNLAVLKAQFRCWEVEADNNAYLSIAVGYCDSDGSSPTLLFHIDDATEIDKDDYVNRQWTAADQSNYSLTQGQRLIVEVGAYFNNTKNETDVANIVINNNQVSDLPENDTDTNIYNCWFETGDTFAEASGEPAAIKLGPMFTFA